MPFATAVVVTPIAPAPLTATAIETLVAADATNGNRFVANRKTLLRVKNTGAAAITVTLVANFLVHGLALPSKTFSVPATTGDVLFTGFDNVFNQNDAGEVYVTFSAVTGVTLQIINPL